MFDFGGIGLLYGVLKDIKEYLTYTDEDKRIDSVWLEKSGFKVTAEQNGFQLRLARPDRIASLELDGWEVMYEIDKIKRIRRRIVRENHNGSVDNILMGKRI